MLSKLRGVNYPLDFKKKITFFLLKKLSFGVESLCPEVLWDSATKIGPKSGLS